MGGATGFTTTIRVTNAGGACVHASTHARSKRATTDSEPSEHASAARRPAHGDADDVAAFRAWLASELDTLPGWALFPGVLTEAAAIICCWRQRFDKAQWVRMAKHGRMVKELNEIAPVIAQTQRWVDGEFSAVRPRKKRGCKL